MPRRQDRVGLFPGTALIEGCRALVEVAVRVTRALGRPLTRVHVILAEQTLADSNDFLAVRRVCKSILRLPRVASQTGQLA